MSDQQDETHYDDTPGAKTEKSQTAAERYEYFIAALNERADSIASMLPSTVTREKFLNSAIAAIKRDPNIINATPRSFLTAVTEAAQDGLLPDGKEGVINVYKGVAKWLPMFQGIRKRARELDRLIIDAQVVYEKDKFIWHQGDEPRIEHEPAAFGGRGAMVGSYAIFRREERDGGEILHREVMDKQQIMDVKSQSKQQDGLLWGKFETEAWRKTVGRRGFKTTPVSDNLMQIVRRDDDLFDFNQERAALPAPAKREPPPAPKPAALEHTKPITLDIPDTKKAEPVPAAGQVEIVRHGEDQSRSIRMDIDQGAAEVYSDFMRDARKELSECLNEAAVDEIRERVKKDLKVEDIPGWVDDCAARATILFGGGTRGR